MIANRMASLPRSKGGLVDRRWLQRMASSRASFDSAQASFSRPGSIFMPSDRSRWATDGLQSGRDALDRSVVLMDRRVQEMVAIETAQVAHQIGEHPLALLAGFAGADDEVRRRQAVVAFQDAEERAGFGRKALAGRPVEHLSQPSFRCGRARRHRFPASTCGRPRR